ncbi:MULTISPECIES: helix-turn-helix domain-containing protein [unclassified Streptomyces]|uniref:helix-turn-helix domain-containing protein n=1 Tax=unclassified Streptomyces TaxID=2593676 RepID=UPI00342D53C6
MSVTHCPDTGAPSHLTLVLDTHLAAAEFAGREALTEAVVAELLAGLARDLALRAHAAEHGCRAATVLLGRIEAYILHHLCDRDLTPDRIAAAHHISTRYLHRLFQRQELTVAAWIKAQRLARCRHDLADPGLCRLPVHAIAARWGFAQSADFSRAFRAAYGTTPTGFRSSAAGAAGALSANEQCAYGQRQPSSAPTHSTA